MVFLTMVTFDVGIDQTYVPPLLEFGKFVQGLK